MAGHFSHFDQSFLETVDSLLRTRDGSSDAVFAEAGRVDAELSEHGQDGRWHTSVSFEFHGHHVVHLRVLACCVAMEMQVEIDGETFGHGAVDERDTLEAITHSGFEFIETKSASLFDEVGRTSPFSK